MRLNWTWKIKRRFHAEIGHAVLDDLEVDGDDTGHLNGTAEGDLTITLREMQVADGKSGTLDVDWKVDLGASGQVLDVAVTAVLWSTRNRASLNELR